MRGSWQNSALEKEGATEKGANCKNVGEEQPFTVIIWVCSSWFSQEITLQIAFPKPQRLGSKKLEVALWDVQTKALTALEKMPTSSTTYQPKMASNTPSGYPWGWTCVTSSRFYFMKCIGVQIHTGSKTAHHFHFLFRDIFWAQGPKTRYWLNHWKIRFANGPLFVHTSDVFTDDASSVECTCETFTGRCSMVLKPHLVAHLLSFACHLASVNQQKLWSSIAHLLIFPSTAQYISTIYV